MADFDPRLAAEAIKRHLSPVDLSLVAQVMLTHTERFWAEFTGYAGMQVSERALAGIMLRIAKRIAAGDPS